jgi:hypothetical protein
MISVIPMHWNDLCYTHALCKLNGRFSRDWNKSVLSDLMAQIGMISVISN